MTKEYEFKEQLNDEIVILDCVSDEYCNIIWTLCSTKKEHVCKYTGDTIPKGEKAFRPLTNGYNRMDRLSIKAIRQLKLQQNFKNK